MPFCPPSQIEISYRATLEAVEMNHKISCECVVPYMHMYIQACFCQLASKKCYSLEQEIASDASALERNWRHLPVCKVRSSMCFPESRKDTSIQFLNADGS